MWYVKPYVYCSQERWLNLKYLENAGLLYATQASINQALDLKFELSKTVGCGYLTFYL